MKSETKKVASSEQRQPESALEIARIKEVLAKEGERRVRLAEKLDVSESRISEYLGGRRSPTREGWIILGKLALKHRLDDPFYFWEKAGIDRESLAWMAGEIRQPVVEGKPAPIPRFREVAGGREEAGPPIELPLELVPDPSRTICLCVDENSIDAEGAPGGLYILDTFMRGTADIRACGKKVIMVRYAPESPQQMFIEGLYAGQIVTLYRDSKSFFQIHARLMPMIPNPSPGAIVPLSLGLYEDAEAMSGLTWEDREGRSKRASEICKRVGSEFPLTKGVNILGIVLGYFSDQSGDDSLGFE